MRCSASAYGKFAPSRNGRSRASRGYSCARAHQADEDILERAFARMEVLDVDVELGEPLEERRNAALATMGVVGHDQRMPIVGQLERVTAERCRQRGERLLQLQSELLLTELAHETSLLLDYDQRAPM